MLVLLFQIYFVAWSLGNKVLQVSNKLCELQETSDFEKTKLIRPLDSSANIPGRFPHSRQQKRSKSIKRRTHSTKSSIDMVNDYYPYVDFKFVFPDISPNVKTTSNIFMIILVNSGAKGEESRKQRQVIRQTWGNRKNCEIRQASKDKEINHLRWLLVFVVGKAGQGTNDDELNLAEARQHNDMLIGNIEDNYINNVIKLYMGHVWASRFDIKYTLKTDDDVYVRIPRVLKYLVNASFPKPFYGGCMFRSSKVKRDVGNKWAISWKYYAGTHYASYSPGAFFILSSDLLNGFFNYVYKRKPFHTDDAYVGLVIRDLGVNATNIPSFALKKYMNKFIGKFNDCSILVLDAIGHDMDPETNRFLHKRFQKLLCGDVQMKC